MEFYVGLLIKLCVEILMKPFNVSFLSTYEFPNPYYLPDLKGKGEKKLSLKLKCVGNLTLLPCARQQEKRIAYFS